MTSLKKSLCLFPALALMPTLALAQDVGGVHEVSVSLADCQRMVEHVPDAGVAYEPGVDVYGNPVVPAEGDQPLGAIELPDEIVIDFGFDFAGAYGIPNTGLETATADILTINYDLAAGGLTVNGQPLKAAHAKAVRQACELMLTGGGAQAK